MRKTIIPIIIFSILALFLLGCEGVDVSKVSDEDLERISEKAVVCNKPYIRVGTECCLDKDDNSICDSDEGEQQEAKLTAIEVVEKYLQNMNVETIDEEIGNNKDSLKYLSGYAKDYYTERIRYLTELKKIFNEFYNDYWVLCKKTRTNAECSKDQKTLLDDFNSPFKVGVIILSVELKEELGDKKTIHVEREQIYYGGKETIIRDYLLKKENGEWKIYDNVNPDGSKFSDISINEIKRKNQEVVKKRKEIYDNSLDTGEVSIKKDKCSYIDEQYQNKLLTVTEYEYELSICYQGKYISYAQTQKDTTVCNEIVKVWYYGPCIAIVASEIDDISLCEGVEYKEWEAKGYFEKLNTKDHCYYSFVTYEYLDIKDSEIDEICSKISNAQMKSQCLQYKDLGLLSNENTGNSPYPFSPDAIKKTMNGITVSLENYTFEKKGEDWGKLKTMRLIIDNQGNEYLFPVVSVTVFDPSIDLSRMPAKLLDIGGIIDVNEYMIVDLNVDLSFTKIKNEKELRIMVGEGFFSFKSKVNFEVPVTFFSE